MLRPITATVIGRRTAYLPLDTAKPWMVGRSLLSGPWQTALTEVKKKSKREKEKEQLKD